MEYVPPAAGHGQPLATLLAIMVIALSLTLPSLCYLVWENVSQAPEPWYPTLQLTVYLDKVLDEAAALKVIGVLKQENGVAKSTIFRAKRRWASSESGLVLAAL